MTDNDYGRDTEGMFGWPEDKETIRQLIESKYNEAVEWSAKNADAYGRPVAPTMSDDWQPTKPSVSSIHLETLYDAFKGELSVLELSADPQTTIHFSRDYGVTWATYVMPHNVAFDFGQLDELWQQATAA